MQENLNLSGFKNNNVNKTYIRQMGDYFFAFLHVSCLFKWCKKLMLASVIDGSNGTVNSARYLLRAPSAVNSYDKVGYDFG